LLIYLASFPCFPCSHLILLATSLVGKAFGFYSGETLSLHVAARFFLLAEQFRTATLFFSVRHFILVKLFSANVLRAADFIIARLLLTTAAIFLIPTSFFFKPQLLTMAAVVLIATVLLFAMFAFSLISLLPGQAKSNITRRAGSTIVTLRSSNCRTSGCCSYPSNGCVLLPGGGLDRRRVGAAKERRMRRWLRSLNRDVL
jgi:hypothetical protein